MKGVGHINMKDGKIISIGRANSASRRDRHTKLWCAKNGQSYRYDSAHIPEKTRASPDQVNHYVCSMNWWLRLRCRTDGRVKPQPRGWLTNSTKPIPNRTPSGRPCENKNDFRQENRLPRCAISYRPAEPPPNPRDENTFWSRVCKRRHQPDTVPRVFRPAPVM